jgi:hypothetical protein
MPSIRSETSPAHSLTNAGSAFLMMALPKPFGEMSTRSRFLPWSIRYRHADALEYRKSACSGFPIGWNSQRQELIDAI